MHPYFTSRIAEQHRQELMFAADTRRSAQHSNARSSRRRRFWALARRWREAVEIAQPCERNASDSTLRGAMWRNWCESSRNGVGEELVIRGSRPRSFISLPSGPAPSQKKGAKWKWRWVVVEKTAKDAEDVEFTVSTR